MDRLKPPSSAHTDQLLSTQTSTSSVLGRLVGQPVVKALLLLVGPIWWIVGHPARWTGVHQNVVDTDFRWSQITPSPSLEYRNCFGGFQCARLEVPMDYHRTDGKGSQIAIAITRLPAKVPIADPRYGGAILINPGGPGGSGVAQVLRYGQDLQNVADAEADPAKTHDPSSRYFDIIGFDPRGVNNTTPGFSCFPDLFSQKAWDLQREADGMLGSSDHSFMRNWQRTVARNIGCSKTLSSPANETEDALGEHVNTPPVARDMLEIVERHGEWRAKLGQQEQIRHSQLYGDDPEQSILKRTRWNRGKENLLYWGRSYGTVLGSTFATMYPDRIGRAVLDAVVDAQRYYVGEGVIPIIDADAIFDRFAAYCHTVGSRGCPFHAEGGSDAIKTAYYALEGRLRNVSIPVPATDFRGPEVITWTDLKTVLRVAMYQPLAAFPMLAKYASEMARGDGTAFADFKNGLRSPSCPSPECLRAGPWSAECQMQGENEASAGLAVLCSDASYLQGLGETAFIKRWQSLKDASSAIGDYWAQMEMDCVKWNVTPKWTLKGPFSGNTSYPLLFVNNILDPVTPLRRYSVPCQVTVPGSCPNQSASAEAMSERFPGSTVLRQDSEGHSTLAAPSSCTAAAIRKYFQTGELPLPGTVCKGDLKPFIGTPDVIEKAMVDDVRQAVLQPFAL
ncbi:hypothetical protein BDV59DRAFT_165593 [Aspergillus ambiguus]|uniref:putative proteinase n=1 Tax=Aspergillus ambiguus TaxID=176160 RepID=UPI003CCE00EC